SVKGRSGDISEKFCTLAMQINFCDTSKFGFSRAIGGILLSLAKIQILYYIGNQFIIKFYSFYDSP
ncbi:hypothetical protein, partial [Alistipes sp.]|uniref:hypothetical protein n=1 Tax=Alistipes sp. TaxID=1872444 RepID=UPI0031FDE6DE